MNILDFPWAGIRTVGLEGTVRFFTELFGFPPFSRSEERQIARFRLAAGHNFELFGPESYRHRLRKGPIIAFRVEDLPAGRRELVAAGVEPATEASAAMEETGFYFRGPDDRHFGLIQSGVEEDPPLPAARSSILTGFAYAGIKTANLDRAGTFFGETLGMRQLKTKARDDNLYRLPSGQMFEVLGPENEFGFDHDYLVLGFRTNDIEAAYERLSGLDAGLPGEISRVGSGYAWFDFHGPDGTVYSVSYSPR